MAHTTEAATRRRDARLREDRGSGRLEVPWLGESFIGHAGDGVATGLCIRLEVGEQPGGLLEGITAPRAVPGRDVELRLVRHHRHPRGHHGHQLREVAEGKGLFVRLPLALVAVVGDAFENGAGDGDLIVVFGEDQLSDGHWGSVSGW